MPRESFPEVKIPFILVYTIYPGVSPTDMETLVTRPIENRTQGGFRDQGDQFDDQRGALEYRGRVQSGNGISRPRSRTFVKRWTWRNPIFLPRPRTRGSRTWISPRSPIMMITLSGPGREPAAHRSRRGDPGGPRNAARGQPGQRDRRPGTRGPRAGGPQAAGVFRAQPL